MFAFTKSASAFCAFNSASKAFPFSSFKSTSTTFAPSSTNNFAVAAPMPDAPPVITATFFVVFPLYITSSILVYLITLN